MPEPAMQRMCHAFAERVVAWLRALRLPAVVRRNTAFGDFHHLLGCLREDGERVRKRDMVGERQQ
jgi:hypothetical protein